MSLRFNPFQRTKSQFYSIFTEVSPELKEASEEITRAITDLKNYSFPIGFTLKYEKNCIVDSDKMTIYVEKEKLEDQLVAIVHQLAISHLDKDNQLDFERESLEYFAEKNLVSKASIKIEHFCRKSKDSEVEKKISDLESFANRYKNARNDREKKEIILQAKLLGLELGEKKYEPITTFFLYPNEDEKKIYVYCYEVLEEIFKLGEDILPRLDGENLEGWAFRLYAQKQRLFCKNRGELDERRLNDQADQAVAEMFENYEKEDLAAFLSDLNLNYVEQVQSYISSHLEHTKQINEYVESLFFEVLENEVQGNLMRQEIQFFFKSLSAPIAKLGKIEQLSDLIKTFPIYLKKEIQFLLVRMPDLFFNLNSVDFLFAHKDFSFEKRVMQIVSELSLKNQSREVFSLDIDDEIANRILSMVALKELMDVGGVFEYLIELYTPKFGRQAAIKLVEAKAHSFQIVRTTHKEILFSIDDPLLLEFYQRILQFSQLSQLVKNVLLEIIQNFNAKALRKLIKEAFCSLEGDLEGLGFLREFLQIPTIQNRVGETLGRLGPLAQFIQNDYPENFKDNFLFIYVYCSEVFESLNPLDFFLVVPVPPKKLRRQVSFVDETQEGPIRSLRRTTSFVQGRISPNFSGSEPIPQVEGILLKSSDKRISWDQKIRRLSLNSKYFPDVDEEKWEYITAFLLYGLYLAKGCKVEDAIIFSKHLLMDLVDQGILTNSATGYLNLVEDRMVECDIG